MGINGIWWSFLTSETVTVVLAVIYLGRAEKKENVRVGRYLAEKHGYEIDLIANPQNETSADSYNKTLGIEQEYKVNAKPTKSSIDNLIRKGAKQADDLVLFVDSGISLDELSSALHDRVRRTNLKTVMVVIDGMALFES